MIDVLTGEGAHAGHTREQVGRCVYCSCGARVQGRMAPGPGSTTGRSQVRLADGFVSYRGTAEQCAAVAGRHAGAVVEPEPAS